MAEKVVGISTRPNSVSTLTMVGRGRTSTLLPLNESERVDPPSEPHSFFRRHAYAILATLLVVAMAGHTVNQKWASPDFWFHLAAVREFAHSLLHPGNPLVVGNAGDPYLSPYTFALGAIVRATGIDAVDALAVAGLVNLVLLLTALRRFVMTVSNAEFAPLLTLIFTLTAWGFTTWRWSGFFSLNSLGTVLPLSSTFASAVGLFTVTAICSWLRDGRVWRLVLIGALAPLVLLSHPITGMWIALVGAAFVISEMKASNMSRVLALGGVVAAGGLVALLWPFASIWQTLVKSKSFDGSNQAVYRSVATRTVLALPGFVALTGRFLRRHRDPLALAAAFNLVMYVGGYLSGHEALGRVLPGIVLMAHVALAVWIAELIPQWSRISMTTRCAVSALVIVVVGVGAVTTASGAIRAVPRDALPARFANDARLASLVEPYEVLPTLIGREDVVVASHRLAIGVAASSGKVLSPPTAASFVDDVARRARITATLLSPLTPPSEFRRLVQRHGVEWFVVTPSESRHLVSRVQAGDLKTERESSTFVVFRVVDRGRTPP
jgi:hypothetical protein